MEDVCDMKKKYFFFDIDGTLTDKSTGILVDSAIETIKPETLLFHRENPGKWTFCCDCDRESVL